jgi:uncharacterized protein
MITDPLFYAAAIPAVIISGLSKGGFGGGVGLMAVPLMALTIPPLQAAGIMLPILLVMDVVAVLSYRGSYDRKVLRLLVPAGLAGIAIGWLAAAWISESAVRLIVGVVALLFTLDYWFRSGRAALPARPSPMKGRFWATVSGFTSFVSHAGGPPFQMYVLPLRLEPRIFAGTAVMFFAIVNAAKVVPYFFLGQFSTANLTTSAVLMPLAVAAAMTGVWLVKVVSKELFYRVTYTAIFMVSLKLIWDGVTGLI